MLIWRPGSAAASPHHIDNQASASVQPSRKVRSGRVTIDIILAEVPRASLFFSHGLPDSPLPYSANLLDQACLASVNPCKLDLKLARHIRHTLAATPAPRSGTGVLQPVPIFAGTLERH